MSAKPAPDPDDVLVVSYLTLRRFIGTLGLLFPFVVALGAHWIFNAEWQQSLSAYYYTGMRDVFVGTLWAIGIFLFAYPGYNHREDLLGNFACVFALGVSLFPTACDRCNPGSVSYLHWGFAAALFLILSYFSLALFTETDQPKPTRRKLQRNVVYRVCGAVMLACLGAILLINRVHSLKQAAEGTTTIFWLESATIVSFGISWLVKGQAILADDMQS
jgi:hypothetical protein